jgi:hypothetical protein
VPQSTRPFCEPGIDELLELKLFESDASGDLIYMHNCRSALGRLDFSNPASPSFSWLTDVTSEGNVLAFVVNSNGDAIVGASRTGSISDQVIRVYLRAGGFLNISSSAGSCFTTGLGADGGFTDSVVFNEPVDPPGHLAILHEGCHSIAKTDTAIFFGAKTPVPSNYFVELASGPTLVKHTVSALQKVTRIYGYRGGVIVQGQDAQGNSGLVRYAGSPPTFTALLTPGQYVISHVSVAPTGEITFAGRRASDNARILGNIPADGSTVTVIPQKFAGDVQQLIRLN